MFEQALERGVDDLWRDVGLSLYVDGELDREEAVDRVGRTRGERAERERETVAEDVDWTRRRESVKLTVGGHDLSEEALLGVPALSLSRKELNTVHNCQQVVYPS